VIITDIIISSSQFLNEAIKLIKQNNNCMNKDKDSKHKKNKHANSNNKDDKDDHFVEDLKYIYDQILKSITY